MNREQHYLTRMTTTAFSGMVIAAIYRPEVSPYAAVVCVASTLALLMAYFVGKEH